MNLTSPISEGGRHCRCPPHRTLAATWKHQRSAAPSLPDSSGLFSNRNELKFYHGLRLPFFPSFYLLMWEILLMDLLSFHSFHLTPIKVTAITDNRTHCAQLVLVSGSSRQWGFCTYTQATWGPSDYSVLHRVLCCTVSLLLKRFARALISPHLPACGRLYFSRWSSSGLTFLE